MVDRVQITSNRIILRNASDNTVFDTNNLYIRCGDNVSSSIRASGYNSTPMYYGVSGYGLRDHGNGGFRSSPIPGKSLTATNAATNPSVTVDIGAPGGGYFFPEWHLWNASADQGSYRLYGTYKDTLQDFYIDGQVAGKFSWYGYFVETGIRLSPTNYWGVILQKEPLIFPSINSVIETVNGVSTNATYPKKSGSYYFPPAINKVYDFTHATSGVKFGTDYSGGGTYGVEYTKTPRMATMVVITTATPTRLSARVSE